MTDRKVELTNYNPFISKTNACVICQKKYIFNELLAYNNCQCQTRFHFKCLKTHIKYHNKCPICRNTITDNEDDYKSTNVLQSWANRLTISNMNKNERNKVIEHAIEEEPEIQIMDVLTQNPNMRQEDKEAWQQITGNNIDNTTPNITDEVSVYDCDTLRLIPESLQMEILLEESKYYSDRTIVTSQTPPNQCPLLDIDLNKNKKYNKINNINSINNNENDDLEFIDNNKLPKLKPIRFDFS